MKIKSILAKLGIIGILATSMLTESVSALSLNSNGDTINKKITGENNFSVFLF